MSSNNGESHGQMGTEMEAGAIRGLGRIIANATVPDYFCNSGTGRQVPPLGLRVLRPAFLFWLKGNLPDKHNSHVWGIAWRNTQGSGLLIPKPHTPNPDPEVKPAKPSSTP